MSNKEVYDKLGDRGNNGATKWKANCYVQIHNNFYNPPFFAKMRIIEELMTLIDDEARSDR